MARPKFAALVVVDVPTGKLPTTTCASGAKRSCVSGLGEIRQVDCRVLRHRLFDRERPIGIGSQFNIENAVLDGCRQARIRSRVIGCGESPEVDLAPDEIQACASGIALAGAGKMPVYIAEVIADARASEFDEIGEKKRNIPGVLRDYAVRNIEGTDANEVIVREISVPAEPLNPLLMPAPHSTMAADDESDKTRGNNKAAIFFMKTG